MGYRQAEELDKVFKRLTDLPSLPAVVERLRDLCSRDTPPRRLAELIGTDQGLTVKVLRLANCAFYALRAPVASLEQASTLLGVKTLKSVVLAVSEDQLLEGVAEGFDPLGYWRHAVACALACRLLARRVRPEWEDTLAVAGLLHDCGVGTMARHLKEDYGLVLRAASCEGRPLAAVEEEVFGRTHAEVGFLLSARWHLPEAVREAIRHHLLDREGLAAAGLEEDTRRAVEVLRLARSRVAALGVAPGSCEESSRARALEAPEWMGIAPEDLERTLEPLEGEIARVESLVGLRAGAAEPHPS